MEAAVPVPSALERPTVSVLIAAYNAGTFLHRAVRSALAQSRPPLEVLIVDDASTDDSLAVANAMAAEDSRIRVLTLQVNSGPAAARNVGLSVAKGDWIAILDADDAYMPSRLERLSSACAGKSVDIVLDNFLFFDHAREASTSTALTASDAIEPINLHEFVAHARPYGVEVDWGLLKPMFRREFLDVRKLRYQEFSRHGEDFLLMFQALHAGGRCMLVRTAGYLYSTRDSGMSRTTVNYEMMIQHMNVLLNDRAIVADILLSKLLRQRVRALKQLSTECDMNAARERGDYFRVMFLISTDMSLARRAAKLAYRKMKSAFRGA